MERREIRIALPSKGVLQKKSIEFLADCGMKVYRPNARQYEATIPSLPRVKVMFQRPGDIVVGVREGSMDFGISGWDLIAEKSFGSDAILTLHDALGYGPCSLNLAVPNAALAHNMADLATWASDLAKSNKPLRIASKFPNITRAFLDQHGISNYTLVNVEGTLEIAPAIGFADLIADLVSSGITLRDNHLRPLEDGQILASQACLIANRQNLKQRPEVLDVARYMLEYIEAYQRANNSYQVTANMRGDSPEAIAASMFEKPHIRGLQGPTVSKVVAAPHLQRTNGWYAVNIIVQKHDLFQAIRELREIGGSGVIVTPCTYIFEEEPARYRAMVRALE
ncbi:MAG: ATP phosphoribosyltransferase [Chloroflexota bacterium]